MEKEIVVVQQNTLITQIPKSLRGVAENTRLTYENALNNYLKYLNTNKLDMGFDTLQDWVYSMENPKTQNTYLQALKKVLRELYADDPRFPELEKNLKKLKLSKADKSIKESDYLTYKEVQKLIKKSPYKWGLIIEALFWSGCRITELLSIKLVNCAKQKKHIAVTIVGKGSKERTVYFPLKLFKDIKAEFKGSVYLFEHHSKKYNRVYVSRKVSELGLEILDRSISAHTLRHSKVMYLKEERKLSPDQIQKAVGHADVSTTLKHYYHGTPSAEDQGIL